MLPRFRVSLRLFAVACLGFLIMNLTHPVELQAVMVPTRPGPTHLQIAFSFDSWTWSDLAAEAAGNLVGGAAAGAVSGAFIGPGILTAAGVGALAGAAWGAGYYVGRQAYHYFFGDVAYLMVPDATFD